MKRRKFVSASAMATTLTIPNLGFVQSKNAEANGNEYYEMRSYELAFGGNRRSLMNYLKEILLPALRDAGGGNATTFKELGDAEPTKIWAMISYPDLSAYEQGLIATTSDTFLEQAKEHAGAGKTYNRYTSFLLRAFNGMPQMIMPGPDQQLFELRIYEGENDDAVRRKISMFDREEITLFNKVGLDPVLFGNMIIGPYMPSLVYMLAFENIEARSKAWGKFIAHPEWDAMRVRPEYANSVSNIRKIFLQYI